MLLLKRKVSKEVIRRQKITDNTIKTNYVSKQEVGI
jgi:hypothetical protein